MRWEKTKERGLTSGGSGAFLFGRGRQKGVLLRGLALHNRVCGFGQPGQSGSKGCAEGLFCRGVSSSPALRRDNGWGLTPASELDA